MATLWCIGYNEWNECSIETIEEEELKIRSSLTLCEWSKDKKITAVNNGRNFNIYSLKSGRDELLFFGFVRDIQSELTSENESVFLIPNEVYSLCIQYCCDVFKEYWSAGRNADGACGQGIEDKKCSLGRVEAMDNVFKICSGSNGHSVLWIKHDGTLYVNGSNDHGQLGIEKDFMDKHKPVLSGFNQKHSALKCVDGASSDLWNVIVCDDGSVWCAGRIGDEKMWDVFKELVFSSANNPHIVAVAAGEDHALLLSANGAVFAYGDDHYGQLGLNNEEWRGYRCTRPELISFFSESGVGVQSVCCGLSHSLALTEDHKIFAWGWNRDGQCGVDMVAHSIMAPEPVSAVSDIKMKRIECGFKHSGCMSVDGEVFLWGNNEANKCCGGEQKSLRIPQSVNEYILKDSKKEEISDFVLCSQTTLFLLR